MRGRIRLRERGLFYRSRLLRELAALGRPPRLWRGAPDIAHLAYYGEWTSGPVQRDESLFLHSLVRTLRPATVVEIGSLQADTAFNLLLALGDDARLYSFDVDPAAEEFARARCGHDPRFTFRLRSQDAIEAADLDGRSADFVFLDAAHELELNQAAFERLRPLLSPRAIVAIHDTGAIPRWIVRPEDPVLDMPDRWAADGFEHQPGEREFVNWLLEAHPEFAQLHLHSERAFRHGITLLQQTAPLPRPEVSSPPP